MKVIKLLSKVIIGGCCISLMIFLKQFEELKDITKVGLLTLVVTMLSLVSVEVLDERRKVAEGKDKEERETAVSKHQKTPRRRRVRRLTRSSRKRSDQKSRRK